MFMLSTETCTCLHINSAAVGHGSRMRATDDFESQWVRSLQSGQLSGRIGCFSLQLEAFRKQRAAGRPQVNKPAQPTAQPHATPEGLFAALPVSTFAGLASLGSGPLSNGRDAAAAEQFAATPSAPALPSTLPSARQQATAPLPLSEPWASTAPSASTLPYSASTDPAIKAQTASHSPKYVQPSSLPIPFGSTQRALLQPPSTAVHQPPASSDLHTMLQSTENAHPQSRPASAHNSAAADVTSQQHRSLLPPSASPSWQPPKPAHARPPITLIPKPVSASGTTADPARHAREVPVTSAVDDDSSNSVESRAASSTAPLSPYKSRHPPALPKYVPRTASSSSLVCTSVMLCT